MSESSIAEYFEARRQVLVALGKAAVHSHHGLAGTARELVVREFLTAHLPAALKVGSGQVFGHNWAHGNAADISTQQDVVIYRDDYPVLEVAGIPLFFFESVVATVEVKTNFVPAELPKILLGASSVRTIQPVEVATFQMGSGGPHLRSKSRRVLCGVFYFRGLEARTPLVRDLNAWLASSVPRSVADYSGVPGPDFFYSAQAGLIVRNSEFNVLDQTAGPIEGIDDVVGKLSADEMKPGAYRRVFGDEERWRGLQAIILELAERCQRYAASYATLTKYV